MTSSAAEALLLRKQKIHRELVELENKILDKETQMLQADYSAQGSVTKGFEGFLSSKDVSRRRNRQPKPEEYWFSMSSLSAPVVKN